MKNHEELLAGKLLQINAIKLQPQNPFTWASGWNSPIYNDDRRILSYPDVRNFVKVEMARIILEHYPDVQAIAGVATGAIAFSAIVADTLGLPCVYVRSTPKDHGLENMVEGNLKPGQKVVVIEDLVSTGGSSLNAVETVRNCACDVIGMVALFNYEFPMAVKRFRDANVHLESLCTYSTMLDVAVAAKYISQEEAAALMQWRKDPASWTPDVEI